MEQYITFKKLLNKLEEFADRHPNINSFGFGNLVEFGKDVDNTTPLYPLLFVVPQGITYNEGLTTYSLQIFLADRLDDDNDGSIDIVSEMSLISKDLMGTFKLNQDFMYLADFDFPLSSQPFMERFNDVLAGVTTTINFNVSDYLDVCQLNDFMTNHIHITGEFFNTDNQNVYILIRVPSKSGSPIIYEHPMTGSTSVDVKVPVETGEDYQVVIINYRGAMTYEWSVGNELLETNDCQSFQTFGVFDLQNSYSLDITMDPSCPEPSPTPTPTQTLTPTPTITPTETITPTPTLTQTPTITPSITPTITPTETITPTPSITSSITPTPTITPTRTLTPTPTPSPIPQFDLLTEGGDTITTEGNDPIRTEQN